MFQLNARQKITQYKCTFKINSRIFLVNMYELVIYFNSKFKDVHKDIDHLISFY
jgi:hypothetical protein